MVKFLKAENKMQYKIRCNRKLDAIIKYFKHELFKQIKTIPHRNSLWQMPYHIIVFFSLMKGSNLRKYTFMWENLSTTNMLFMDFE